MSSCENSVRTIPVKIQYDELTNSKQSALDTEYDNFQSYIHGDTDVELYSATQQTVDQEQKYENLDNRNYPVPLRNDCFDVQRENNNIAEYWVRT